MKGQAFTVFRMLIGAVFAVGLLVLVYAVVSGMTYPLSGVEETKNLLLQATRAPGLCFEREFLQFVEGESFGKDVFGFGSTGTLRFRTPAMNNIACGSTVCEVTASSGLKVSAECSSAQDCEIWFGSTCT